MTSIQYEFLGIIFGDPYRHAHWRVTLPAGAIGDCVIDARIPISSDLAARTTGEVQSASKALLHRLIPPGGSLAGPAPDE
jgi:hypothetical protein